LETTADKANRNSFWAFLGPGIFAIIVGVIAAWATVTGDQKNFEGALAAAQKNFETALATAQNNLDKAAKSAFESARGASALQDYRNGQELVAKIEDELDESAVQRSVKGTAGTPFRGDRSNESVGRKRLRSKIGDRSNVWAPRIIDLSVVKRTTSISDLSLV
jgi:hypothetical protein